MGIAASDLQNTPTPMGNTIILNVLYFCCDPCLFLALPELSIAYHEFCPGLENRPSESNKKFFFPNGFSDPTHVEDQWCLSCFPDHGMKESCVVQ